MPETANKYPCYECGKRRTKAEGGTTFTVCDECWDKAHKKTMPETEYRDLLTPEERKFVEKGRPIINRGSYEHPNAANILSIIDRLAPAPPKPPTLEQAAQELVEFADKHLAVSIASRTKGRTVDLIQTRDRLIAAVRAALPKGEVAKATGGNLDVKG